MQISLYLLDEEISTLDEASDMAVAAGFKQIDMLAEAGVDNAVAFTKEYRNKTPEWVEFVSPLVSVENVVSGHSLAFVLFFRINDRVFALPFGSGHLALDKKRLQRDFGFQIALRALNPQQLRMIDIRNIDLKTRQKRSSLSYKGTMQHFDVAIDNELAFKICGYANDGKYGGRIAGGTSLSFNSASIQNLLDLCADLLALLKTPVQKDFADMNRFEIEDDEQVLQRLDGWLQDKLINNELDDISIALPSLESTLASQYAICSGRTKHTVPELNIQHVRDTLLEIGNGSIDFDKVNLKGLDDNGNPLPKFYHHLKDCLVAQVQEDGDDTVHILSFGKWHKIKRNLVDSINREVKRIPSIYLPDYLPPCEEGWEEGRYNKIEVPKKYPQYIVLDCDTFREGLKYSSIEVCDLYTPNKHLICAKHYYGSQTLSHLFSQGMVSAKFLKYHQDYRDFLHTKVKDIDPFDVNNVNEGDYTVVYAIIFDENRKLPDDLPFFSKVTLVENARIIAGMGFKVSLYHIPLIKKATAKNGNGHTGGNGKTTSKTKKTTGKKVITASAQSN